jgi:multiple sugar transport system ATP-binding protein
MASVAIDNVRKHYGDLEVLHGVDIDIDDGSFVVLVGPSGCGKSTLLRMLAGLEEISDGEIRIGGKVVNDLAPKQRDLAMVFQSYALYPHMTVAQNMGFSLRLAKVDKARIAEDVGRAAEILGLTDYLDRFPRHLSGGQRQRVAMGRAIVRNPKVFLFDEPLSNLDAKLRGQMRAEIKALQQRLGTTTVYVTHDQTEAMTMADKIVVMRDGKVEQIGAPMDIYNDPINHFVAGFIGSPPMNFLRGEVVEQGIAFPDGSTVAMPVAQLAAGRKVDVGIRPKHFQIDNGERPDAVPFTVDLVEPTGDEMELRGKMLGQGVSLVVPTRSIRAGDRLNLVVPVESAFLFDAGTGERLKTRPTQ